MPAPDSRNPSSPEESAIKLLERQVAGLFYMSETDAPLEVVEWGDVALSPELVLEKSARPPGTPVQRLDVKTFFAPATREADWHGPSERERAAQFRALVAILERVLSTVEVWRVGGVEADVYILGRTTSGTVAGVKTRVVQT